MCCFSQRVEAVADTSIFARGADGKQFLVYGMTYAAGSDLAMVLPLPVPPRPPEDAVRFVNLQGYPDFFADLSRGFPQMVGDGVSLGIRSLAAARPTLQVHDVGAFEASFVPCLDDFDRLDERFRIPRDVWDRLPAYRDYGFAVFKLKASGGPGKGMLGRLVGRKKAAPRRVHPMAFEFPRRNRDLLFFPTLHIHDRQVHAEAAFDHVLYCQADDAGKDLAGWERSRGFASEFMNVGRTEGLVVADAFCWKLPLEGRLENKDTLIGKTGSVPRPASRLPT